MRKENNIVLKDKRCLLLLEFGIPHYRHFIYRYFESIFKDLTIFHSGERFDSQDDFNNKKGLNIKFPGDISMTLFNIFQFYKFDVIISTLNFRKPHTWIPFFLFPKKKWIFWGQGIHTNDNLLLNSIRRSIINNSIGYVSYTNNGKSNLLNIGVKPNKISVAYNTLKIENAELTTGKNYLLYVGRIQKRKGIEKVLKCMKNTTYRLVIIGDGDYKQYLIELANTYKIENQIKFIPAIYDDNQLKYYFSNALAYISPDHVGLGVVHSFAYGVPIITCRNKKHAPEFEYCNDNNSYLYDNDSDLKGVIKKAYNEFEIWIQKSKNAYFFYHDFLNYENVLKAFDYQFSKITGVI